MVDRLHLVKFRAHKLWRVAIGDLEKKIELT